MEKLDLRKQYKKLYTPSAKQPEIVDVPSLNFLRIDGAIEPGQGPGTSPGFEQAMQALYGAAYTLKFMLKQRPVDPLDYPVMALEGLWWVEDGRFDIHIKDNWFYTLQIMQPEQITPDLFAEALAKLRKKRGSDPAFDRLRLEPYAEGLCVQIMHLGPYVDEPATLDRMRAFAGEQGYQLHGLHHEIYTGDPRKGDPAKLKTVLRHPIQSG